MSILIVGASGATGRLLVEQLLNTEQHVRAVVRSASSLPQSLIDHDRLTIIETSIHEATDDELSEMVTGCKAIASCLGHNLTRKGIWGHPRRLVTDVTRRLCHAVESTAPKQPVKFVLMNTAGNSNRDLKEPISLAQRAVIQLLRIVIPPHRDNELASDFLRTNIDRHHSAVSWTVVRPDTLVNNSSVTNYTTHASPTRSAIFNPGRTSRINTAHFMSQLILNDDLWESWAGQMPVIYNAEQQTGTA